VADVAGTRNRGNLRWAALFAVTVLAVAYAAGWLTNRVDGAGERIAWGVVALTFALAPIALIWLVGEVHLRWSPRDGVPRGVVGWSLAVLCLGLILFCAPYALYIFIFSLGSAFGW